MPYSSQAVGGDAAFARQASCPEEPEEECNPRHVSLLKFPDTELHCDAFDDTSVSQVIDMEPVEEIPSGPASEKPSTYA